jgi:polyphosphate kinase 2 (PPK2 family)
MIMQRQRLSALEHLKANKDTYREELEQLQLKLMTLQHGVYQQGHRCIIVTEGIDAAGKGGLIRRATAFMDPRGYRVHPIGAPSEEELAEHYLQRFWRRLPKQGQTVIFDRSWYGRVLVERVDQLANKSTWQRAYKEINEFEQQMVDDGIIVIKLFLSIDKEEQLERFKERMNEPKKRWKITPDDILNRQNWEAYQDAFEDMLDKTSAAKRAWHVVAANNKKHARLDAMQHIAEGLSERIDINDVEVLNPEVEALAHQYLY